MRYLPITILVLLCCALFMAGCSTAGPGSDCDPCATAEAVAPGTNSQAAAASAAGGQKANQAPYVEDTVSPRVKTTVGRGTGDTSSTSADAETREVASGGAQNIALLNPTSAQASTSGGGVGVAVQEAQKTVAGWRSALMLAMTDSPVDMSKLDFIKSALLHAQADLNAAQAAQSSNRPHITNNYSMGGDNTLIGVSTSKTGNQEGIDAEAAKAVANAAVDIATSESNFPPPAPVAPEVPDTPTDGGQ